MQFRRLSHRWLLWLALLLPLAQTAAAWHALSHLGDAREPASAAHQAHCGQCLAAAALDGLATPPVLALALPVAANTAAEAVPARADAPPRRPSPYPARAPPLRA